MTILGSCHCGKTAFCIEGDIPVKLTRCTCSFCSDGLLIALVVDDIDTEYARIQAEGVTITTAIETEP